MDAAGYDELLTQLRGIPVIVNFWAAWCPPCREEATMLAEAGRRHGEQIQFLGVDILDERGAATAFIEEFSLPYPNVFDPPGEIRTAVGGIGQPVTVFYDAGGTIVDKVEGQLSQKDLDRNIELLLKG
jgi:cytochrome c biogenesis protein CcmG/thiol:disulfide interchange protein DsbE